MDLWHLIRQGWHGEMGDEVLGCVFSQPHTVAAVCDCQSKGEALTHPTAKTITHHRHPGCHFSPDISKRAVFFHSSLTQMFLGLKSFQHETPKKEAARQFPFSVLPDSLKADGKKHPHGFLMALWK